MKTGRMRSGTWEEYGRQALGEGWETKAGGTGQANGAKQRQALSLSPSLPLFFWAEEG